ncbi:hypothetical protein Pla123a_03050 [Posidoniimonas polymericola]|uniref:STAS/SEC14 domain-containing protein n=1 Tax=Posidoniimonas polymericola TaxID=2528002 RepID=A0A5C5ZEA8_9BACT|nr:hypothetical protein [Posidoniimonas polymericola]TWT85498.1 hypothetical protein Pla123a_03050 [Posidoniimonas polymericola]
MSPRFSIRLPEGGRYLVADGLQGPVTFEVGVEIALGLIAADEPRRWRRYLVDLRGGPTVASDAEKYAFAYHKLDSVGAPRDSRVALIPDPTDRSLDFFETVMLNAGYNLRLFGSEPDAAAWLLAGDDAVERRPAGPPHRDAS